MAAPVQKNQALFESMPIPQAVRQMAVPAVLSQIVVLLYNLADTFFIGKTNDPYMVAGVSLILPVFNITMALGTLIGTGGGAFLPKLMGSARQQEAEKANQFCIGLTVGITALFCLLLFLFAEPLLLFLGAGENTYDYARQYMLIVVALGGIPTVLTSVLSSLLRSLGLSRESGIGVALGGILNIILDPLFMFVLLPAGHEVLGISLATLLSNLIACSYCLWVMLGKQKQLTLRLRPGMPERASIFAILAVGIPAATNVLLFDLDYMVLNKLMSGYTDIPLAAMGIVLKAERFPIQAGIGLCQAMVPLVAFNYTSGNIRRMKDFIAYFTKIGLIIGIGSIAVYELFTPLIIRCFIGDAATVGYGVEFLRIRTPATLFMFLSFFIVHIFQALGYGKTALALCTMRWVGFNIPALLILNWCFGMMGIVWAQLVADILTVTVSFIVYRRQIKILQQKQLC